MALRLRFSGRDDMVDTVRASGTTHWFSPDTMRFFRTRISETLFGPGRRVFVTGETNPSGQRRYSVRVLTVATGDNGAESYGVQTIGAFGAYASLNGALTAASRLAAHVGEDMPRDVDDATAERYATAAGIPLTGGFQ